MRMKTAKMFRTLVVSTAAVGFLLPNSLLAAVRPVATPPHKAIEAPHKALTEDVALQKGGVLVGRLVDYSGAPIAAAPISLLYNNRVVATAQTDKQGGFIFSRLRGGVYRVATPDTQRLYRLWAAGTAPKAAGQVARVVAGQPVVRGRYTRGRVGRWLGSPLGLAAVAATAIAVPVALSQSGCDSAD